MDVNNIYNFVNFISNKTQSGEISDDEFNIALQFVNIELFRYGVGLPENYTAGNPEPPVAWQITNTISDDFRFLITPVSITVGSNGHFAYPADYGAFSSLYYRYTLNNPNNGTPTFADRVVELVTDSELVQRLQNSITKPSVFYPVGVWSALGFKVYPEQVTRINLIYLKIPRTPIRGYTTTPNDETVYDPATSVQTEYPDTLFPNFAARICKYFSINIRDQELYQMAENRQLIGQ